MINDRIGVHAYEFTPAQEYSAPGGPPLQASRPAPQPIQEPAPPLGRPYAPATSGDPPGAPRPSYPYPGVAEPAGTQQRYLLLTRRPIQAHLERQRDAAPRHGQAQMPRALHPPQDRGVGLNLLLEAAEQEPGIHRAHRSAE
ncbi:hypothetical protein SAMN05216359_109181 [Roseateles sp. YR242]|uniref:hypothetical protein n=1 Tax=Roseateles sp. YR242 TaxID=1855305 RepID=UPI0008BF4098|nr:hypothetical protein [Roseateles sp. YR242]SEL46687.1 hypothetical protein SAMN05216359_109181 [Roseateles sp. YR242]